MMIAPRGSLGKNRFPAPIEFWLLGALAAFCACSEAMADEWPQWRGPNRDGVWSERGIIERFDSREIERKWSVPIASGYSGPTVSSGRVYVTDRVVKPKQIERVHCFDCESGAQIWSQSYDCPYKGISYDAGPRASVTIDEGRAFSLGAMGDLYCFDAAKGTQIWKRDLNAEYKIRMPNWGIAASPIIFGNLLIVQIGGQDACLVAFDKRNGQEQWRALSDDAGYSAPVIVEQANAQVVVFWTGNRIVGLDPASGKLHWSFDFDWEQWPIGITTPVIERDMLLFSEAHKGTLLLRMSQQSLAVERLWHRRRKEVLNEAALHCLISTPYVDGDSIYGVDDRGILRCLKLSTGEQVWEDRKAVPEGRWSTVHLIRHQDKTWIFNEQGELIIAKLTRDGFQELSRAKLLDPTTDQLRRRDGVTWSHPAFAYKHIFARNDKELVCADLSAK
jgi:outer membrane protein assembly factor BamB